MILTSSCIAILYSWSSLRPLHICATPKTLGNVYVNSLNLWKLWKCVVTSSKQIPHDFCKAALGSDWLVFHSRMARTTITPWKEEKGKARKVKTRAEVHAMPVEPPVLVEPPVPTEEVPPSLVEVERRRVEVSRLEEVGRLLELSPTQRLAAEARPLMSGGEEPARKELCLTVGGKAPQKEFLVARKVKKLQRYQPGRVALHEICQFQKSAELPLCILPFSHLVCKIAQEVEKFAMHFQVHAILTLQEAAEYYLVGLLEDANLCVIHTKCVMIMPKDI